jgi:hypothetical protein
MRAGLYVRVSTVSPGDSKPATYFGVSDTVIDVNRLGFLFKEPGAHGATASRCGCTVIRRRHQVSRTCQPYGLTTATESGNSMAYIVPVVDRVLRQGNGRGQ